MTATPAQSRALLLDVDGVLVVPPEMYGSRLMKRNPEAVGAFFTGPFRQASTGLADLQELLPPLMNLLGIAGAPETLMAEWFAAENHPNLSLLEALRPLRAAGWHCYLATNQERHRLHYPLHDMRLAEQMDGEFASCTVGARKPDPTYFGRVQQRLGLSPASIVFWDDVQENVDAASRAGWTAFLYTTLEDFQARMALLG